MTFELLDPTGVRVLASWPMILALIGVGGLIGLVGGLFGVGGGFLLTPILLLKWFGLPDEIVLGSASCHGVGIAAGALRRHLRIGRVDLRLGVSIALGAGLGSYWGSQISSGLAELWSGPQHVTFQLVLRGVLLVVLAFVALAIARPVRAGVDAPFQRMGPGPHWPVPGFSDKTFSLSATIVLACLSGLVVGFLGIGGGVVYLPLLVVAVGIQPIYAVRISLVVVLCSAACSTVGYAWRGNVSLTVAMLMIVGSSLGVQVGAMLCQKLHGDRVRKYFALVVVAAMVPTLWRIAELLGLVTD